MMKQSPMILAAAQVATDWMNRFLPMLRFGSPDLGFEFQRLKKVQQPEPSEDLPEATETEAPEDSEPQQVAEAQEEPAVERAQQECIELQFVDGSSQRLNLQLYVSSHQVMQRILDIDAEKAASA